MFGFFKKKIKAKREDFNSIVKDLQKNISQVHTTFGNDIIEIINNSFEISTILSKFEKKLSIRKHI